MEPLPDPLGDRVVSQLPPPPQRPLQHSMLFPNNSSIPNWKLLRNHLQVEGSVSKTDLQIIVQQASNIFKSEPNMLIMQDPVTVVGDIHGQYHDLLKLLQIGGDPENTKYLFLGDYVDRGSFSIECVLLLYSLKINYPQTIYMIRGNHECRQMTSFFNFRTECIYKYDLSIYDLIMDSFDCLPLACILNERFLTVHGGLSPQLRTVEDISRVYRFLEPPRQGIFCDLLWSDPVDSNDGKLPQNFKNNGVRGCSYYYGAEAVNKFVQRNDLIAVIRAHQAQLDGYKMHKWNGNQEFPLVITLFSAPNYCDVYNNKGAIIKFNNNTLNIQQYTYSAHPYLLPDFMDIFSWSIPFVIEKVMEVFFQVLKDKPGDKSQKGEKGALIEELKDEYKEIKKASLRGKVKTVSRMMKMFKTIREENESVVQLKGFCPDSKVPRGLILSGRSALQGALEDFQQAKKVDGVNEKRPDNQQLLVCIEMVNRNVFIEVLLQ